MTNQPEAPDVAQDIKALRDALAAYDESGYDEGRLLVPYEVYRAALDGYRYACDTRRIARLLDALEAARAPAVQQPVAPWHSGWQTSNGQGGFSEDATPPTQPKGAQEGGK
jgi:hypothetical protein